MTNYKKDLNTIKELVFRNGFNIVLVMLVKIAKQNSKTDKNSRMKETWKNIAQSIDSCSREIEVKA